MTDSVRPGTHLRGQIVQFSRAALRERYPHGVYLGLDGFARWGLYARAMLKLPLVPAGSAMNLRRVLDVLTANEFMVRTGDPLWTRADDGVPSTPAGWLWRNLPDRMMALLPAEVALDLRNAGGIATTFEPATERTPLPVSGPAPVDITSAEPVPEARLAQIEAQAGPLPTSYRAFLARHGAARLATTAVHPSHGFVVDQPFFGTDGAPGVPSISEVHAQVADRFTGDFLPIAPVQGGLVLLRLCEPDAGSIWYWDDDDPRDDQRLSPAEIAQRLLIRCADDIQSFLAALASLETSLVSPAVTAVRARKIRATSVSDMGASLQPDQRRPRITYEGNGAPINVRASGGTNTPPDDSKIEYSEYDYVMARRADDMTGCVRELMSMTVVIPLIGPQNKWRGVILGSETFVRAYTSNARLSALGVDPLKSSYHPFADLVKNWSRDEIGLVVNPGDDTQLRLPAALIRRIWDVYGPARRGLELTERGRSALRNGQQEKAEDLFRQAVAAGHNAASSDLFKLLKSQRREDEALAWQRVAAETGNDEAMRRELDELVRSGRSDDARMLLNAKGHGQRLFWTAEYARKLVEAGRPDEAVTWMRPLAEYEHYGASALVEALQATGQTDEVLLWLDRLVAEDNSPYFASRASDAVEYLAANGRAADAEERLRELAGDFTRHGQLAAVTALVNFLLARQRVEDALPFLQRRAAFDPGTGGCSTLVRELHEYGHPEQIEPLLEPIARGELGRSPRLARAELGKHLLREGRYADAERWLRPNAEDEKRPTDFTELGAALIGQRKFGEAATWLYRVARHNSPETLQLLVVALVGDHRPEEAELFLRGRIDDGHVNDYPLLARLLTSEGRGDEAELMLYRLAASGKEYGTRYLVEYLRQEGRNEEAETWLRRPGPRDSNLPVPAGGPTVATIVMTATITSAVVPFIQALAAEAAKDAYRGAKSLIRRLCRRQDGSAAQPGDDRADDNEEVIYLLRVRDPELRITLHIRSDTPTKAIEALQGVEVADLVEERDAADPAQLFWDAQRRSWRVMGTRADN
jgi:tetratricopeptide (TPR) repeat protein